LDERAQLASASVSFDSRIEHRRAHRARCIFAQTDCKIRSVKGGLLMGLNWTTTRTANRRATDALRERAIG